MKFFPQILSETFTPINNWKNGTSNVQRHNTSEGMAFMTKGWANTAPKKKMNKDHITATNVAKRVTIQMNRMLQRRQMHKKERNF